MGTNWNVPREPERLTLMRQLIKHRDALIRTATNGKQPSGIQAKIAVTILDENLKREFYWPPTAELRMQVAEAARAVARIT